MMILNNVKRFSEFLNESFNDIFCQNCGRKNSFPSAELIKQRGWGQLDICSYCGEERSWHSDKTYYDEHTWNLSNVFFDKFIKGKQYNDPIIDFDIKNKDGKYVFNLKDIAIRRERGQGEGTILMKKIVDWCDDNNLKMELVASNWYGSDINRLVNFYKRFGFKEIKDIRSHGDPIVGMVGIRGLKEVGMVR